jgi:hypothetical protein
VKWAAPKFIADKSRHSLSIAETRFDPFALSLSVKGLKLAEPDGKPLLAFDELFVDFEAASLFKWAWTFDAIRLTGPRARVELLADGRLNWSALIEAFKDEEEKPDSPCRACSFIASSWKRGGWTWPTARWISRPP